MPGRELDEKRKRCDSVSGWREGKDEAAEGRRKEDRERRMEEDVHDVARVTCRAEDLGFLQSTQTDVPKNLDGVSTDALWREEQTCGVSSYPCG
jgi:hypothetical protein